MICLLRGKRGESERGLLSLSKTDDHPLHFLQKPLHTPAIYMVNLIQTAPVDDINSVLIIKALNLPQTRLEPRLSFSPSTLFREWTCGSADIIHD